LRGMLCTGCCEALLTCLAPGASAACRCYCCLQEEMYSFVTAAQDQTLKGKGTTVVQDS
jgi:hypothetical protein